MASFFVPTKFIWRFGGNQVHLCGSFTRWVETVPMIPVEGQAGTYSVIVHLPPGYHQYKFIVDGEWRHDETQPFMPDPLGNVNNWLFVRKPESGPASSQPPFPQAQAQAASPQQLAQAQLSLVPHPAAQPPVTVHGRPAASPRAPSPTESMDVATPEQGDGVMAAIAAQVDEPEYTRKKVREFLSHHTAYELIPESGKVVLLDVDLPVRQAFHALHEQGIASAPLFDSDAGALCGIISASDFIATLQELRRVVSSNANPMSEMEMDQHTMRNLREELTAEGRAPKMLVSLRPGLTLAQVVRTLFDNNCSMAPVVEPAADNTPQGDDGPQVLHMATISGVLACLMRHFRASLASLPLLAQPLSSLPLGTWAPDSSVASLAAAEAKSTQNGVERRDRRRVAPIRTVTASTPLIDALGMLLEAGISCLPVVDESGALVDIYARADITMLAKSNAYSRMQFEDVTVGQALSLASHALPPPQMGSPVAAQWGGASPSSSTASFQDAGVAMAAHKQRVHLCTTNDALRSVVERLSVPGVRRVVIVDSATRRIEGIVSLSDIAAYMLL